MKDVIKGRRIPVVSGLDPFLALKEPGDYYGPVTGFSADKPAVFYLLPLPGRVFAHVQSPPHTFTEEPDGTLTIRASILTLGYSDALGKDFSWHGYLTKGVWQTL